MLRYFSRHSLVRLLIYATLQPGLYFRGGNLRKWLMKMFLCRYFHRVLLA